MRERYESRVPERARREEDQIQKELRVRGNEVEELKGKMGGVQGWGVFGGVPAAVRASGRGLDGKRAEGSDNGEKRPRWGGGGGRQDEGVAAGEASGNHCGCIGSTKVGRPLRAYHVPAGRSIEPTTDMVHCPYLEAKY